MDEPGFEKQPAYEALMRLFTIARGDTDQSRRVADFLLAWYNAAENGAWDPIDLWNLDRAITDDILTVLGLIRDCHRYPDGLGFEHEIRSVWRLRRETTKTPPATENRIASDKPCCERDGLLGCVLKVELNQTEHINRFGRYALKRDRVPEPLDQVRVLRMPPRSEGVPAEKIKKSVTF